MACEIRSMISWLRRTESHEAAGRARHSLVFKDDVNRVDNTRDPTQDGQADVDQEVRATSALQEDTQRGQDEGQDDLADVWSSERHFGDEGKRSDENQMVCYVDE